MSWGTGKNLEAQKITKHFSANISGTVVHGLEKVAVYFKCKGCPQKKGKQNFKKMKKNFLTPSIYEESFSKIFLCSNFSSDHPLVLRYCQFLFWNAHKTHRKVLIKKISNENIPHYDMTTFLDGKVFLKFRFLNFDPCLKNHALKFFGTPFMLQSSRAVNLNIKYCTKIWGLSIIPQGCHYDPPPM